MSSVRPVAPELPAGLEWVNSDDPPRLATLRGRVVLVWFWSGDSIPCANLVQDLAVLQARHHDGLSIVGIHCPKYGAQCASAVVLKAVNRLRIDHPVASDPQFLAWRDYGVGAWPTVAVVDADGRLAARVAGAGNLEQLDALVAALLDEAAEQGLRRFESAVPAVRPEPRTSLRFPGKLLATERLLYVADSGRDRVLECDHDGRVLRMFGSGHTGWLDGRGEAAAFSDPQGLALHRDQLYVADRGNHAVRSVDLADGEVRTVLGTGAPGYPRIGDAALHGLAACAPTDLAVVADHLYIAMTGLNQIWQVDLIGRRASVLAGGGALDRVDGLGEAACFAQPSGLAVATAQLAVADAAASAIRLVRLADRRVSTWVGAGLYDFGDAVGPCEAARLQHPLAVAAGPRGVLFVADSYNGAVKLANPATGKVHRLEVDYRFCEPGGLSVAGGALWLANTGHHEIVRIDLGSGSAKRIAVAE
ncbi:redoxin family protein [Dokdonella koreensis]|uniref:NHL repeat containing protein n=1 Tax=Dokdonella koreensis DS-123 TaxID=1300342 RepID=A0A167GSW8_9GAMM|nr:redoxin family protein [Dokdonella koreensis]ANB17472.1 NHL repeat containing protein [Dokdonella koreensis DS-123]